MSKIIVLASLFSILFGSSKKEEFDYVKISNNIIKPFKKKLENEYQLNLLGGGGGFIDNISEISLSFISDEPTTLEKIRKQYVIMVDELLELYNHSQNIRPYLANYPFTAKNVSIFIIFSNSPNFDIPDRVYTVNLIDGDICYRIRGGDSVDSENYIEESFEEAYFKVYGKEWSP